MSVPSALDAAVTAAAGAQRALAGAGAPARAEWMLAVAAALDADRAELVELAAEETALDPARLDAEVSRTLLQLRLLADVVRDGSALEIVRDADPSATPPVPDLRRMLVPIGPVAVFAASNFPFAFSVLGGDTASAWAAGCAVVVKAHPGHPELSRRTARLAARALDAAGAPAGLIGLVEGHETGVALVAHPGIRAAAFTGSLAGGRALFDIAAARADPIPFYGELGSINPVVVTPDASSARGEEIARGLVESYLVGSGQLCTKPGLVFVPTTSAIPAVAAEAVRTREAGQLLTDAIAHGFASGWRARAIHEDVEVLVEATTSPDGAAPGLLACDAAALGRHPILADELFGPATVLVGYERVEEVVHAVGRLGGTLAAAIHHEGDDDPALDALVDALMPITGRLVFQGWPTGVAVSPAQHHGGPWPATTSVHTSVGTTAVRRFQRPIVFQSAPHRVLPPPLRDHRDHRGEERP